MENANQLATLVAALLGGGTIYKLADLWIRRRPAQVKGELQAFDAVMRHNEALRNDCERLGRLLREIDEENRRLAAVVARLEAELQLCRERFVALEQRGTRNDAEGKPEP